MRKKVDYICEKCSHLGLKPKSRIKSMAFGIFIVYIGVTAIFGSGSLINAYQTGIFDNKQVLFSYGGFYSTIHNFKSDFEISDTTRLKEIAENITKDCEDDYCRTEKIYNELLTFEYMDKDATDLNPIRTWDNRLGDCDMMSYLQMALLKQLDINVYMTCSPDHCWDVIYLKYPKMKIIADLTMHRWEES